MFHGTLALLNQTLRTDSRKLAVHLFLLLFVGFMLFMLIVTVQESRFRGAPGLELFRAISWLNFWFILLASGGYFGSAISEEKEDDTLGLLKMTGLSPLVLLFGKSTSRLVFALLMLSVQIPFTQLAITLGGVTLSQIVAMYIALASFLILMANLGLFCSLVTKSTANSAGLLTVLVILYTVVVMVSYPMLSQYMRYNPVPSTTTTIMWTVVNYLYEVTIVFQIDQVLVSGFSSSNWTIQVWSNLLAGLTLFGFSWLLFERCTRNTGQKTFSSSRFDLFKNFRTLRRKYVGRTWSKAIFWKDFHFSAGGYSSFTLKFWGYGLLLISLPVITIILHHLYGTGIGRITFWEMVGWCFLIGPVYILPFEAVFQASVMFKREIKEQTWSILVMTPHTLSAISREKALASLYSLVPGFFYLILGAAIVPEAVHEFLTVVLFRRFEGFCACTMLAMIYITFVLLVNYVSLYLKWGVITVSAGIAFGVGACYIGTANLFEHFIRAIAGSNDDEFIFIGTSFLLLILSAFFVHLIQKRLGVIAAQ